MDSNLGLHMNCNQSSFLVAGEAPTNRNPDNDSESDDDSQHNQLDLHILEPHLPTKLPALSLKVVSLERKSRR